MTTSEYVKIKGFKSLDQVSNMFNVSTQCLRNWHKNDKNKLDIVLLGCRVKLIDSMFAAQTAKAIYLDATHNHNGNTLVWFNVGGVGYGDYDGEYAISFIIDKGNYSGAALVDCDGHICNVRNKYLDIVFDACSKALTTKMINNGI